MQIFAGKEFTNPIKIIQAFDNESFKEAFSQIEILRKRPDTYLLGYIRYEAKEVFLEKQIESKYPLLYFEAFEEVDGKCEVGQALPDSEEIQKTPKSLLLTSNLSTYPLIDLSTYNNAIERIKTEISEGNTYQLNYTYDWEIQTKLDGFELYQNILPRQTTPYNAYIKNEYEEILSFSPELFFEIKNNQIKTKPMKGTIKRGETTEEDEKNIEFLKHDIKNQAENVMIVDLLRNDLSKIAKTGTVKVKKLFEIETHNTVHQMTSEITAELEKNTTLYDIFDALFPCGSVTGAPKINTMEIIDSLEVGKREIYCGAIGLISPEKTVFSVPIRILQKHNDEKAFKCRVGGGIVWDSVPQEEWEETLTKIKFLASSSRHPEFISGSHDCRTTHEAFNNAILKQIQNDVNNGVQLIETMLVQNGKILYEEKHFQRMTQSAKALGFKLSKWQSRLGFLPQQLKTVKNDYILRLLLDKNGGLDIQELPLEPIKTNIITISQTSVNSKEPLLYHKTDFRPWYKDAMKKIKQGLIFDEIFFNENGELTEGARSNIILQINNKLYTPPVECGLLNGILRQELLLGTRNRKQETGKVNGKCEVGQALPDSEAIQKVPIKEKVLYLSDLQKAEKVFCINSVRGIVEVSMVSPQNVFDTRREKVVEEFHLPVILNLFQDLPSVVL